MSREAFDSLANEEQIWAAFNAWHKNRYGWNLRDTRGHAAEKYDGMVAWAAWQAARAAALEEAAQACEAEAELWQEGVEARLCAARIRALKEK
ncbi:MAG: hypothetical protein ACOY9I_04560 [Pseudomonadota bacterium]